MGAERAPAQPQVVTGKGEASGEQIWKLTRVSPFLCQREELMLS